MKNLKICLLILCLLPVQAVGMPQFRGAVFFMKTIIIHSNKYGSKEVLLDDSDYDLAKVYRWSLKPDHNNFYAKKNYWIRVEGEKKCIQLLMHRFILGLNDQRQVDHIDHNGLNNQRTNLRICTHQQNMCNKRSHVNTSSKYVGVSFHKKTKMWRASIKNKLIHSSRVNIGSYKTENEAAIAYNKAALDFFGEFANLNVIQ